jgi:hypothetical protein
MIVMFGWVKDRTEVGRALSCYCYRCQRTRDWEHWRETEWISFFMIRTIPFLRTNFVVCSACREPIQLDSVRSRQLKSTSGLSDLASFLEAHQLSQKSEVQRRFLLSHRQQTESREKNAA